MRRARLAAVLVLAAAFLPGGAAAGPARPDLARVRVIAVAPFADEAAFSRDVAAYGARRLSELVARAPFEVIAPPRVAEEMRRQGATARELLSPSRTVALGQALGADAVITGRVTFLMVEREREDPAPGFGHISARVDVDIRLLDVATRVNLFQDTFICQTPAPAILAMECAVRDAARRLAP
jgi:curli biogenesis system outer membrane secretion channel CsgG